MSDLLRCEVENRVAWLTIDRPAKRNALTSPMWAALLRHLEAIDAVPDLAAVVLRGTRGSFCAGADLDELRDPGRVEGLRDLGERAVGRLRDLTRPTFAAIDGACFGAGCSLALACDVRICSPTSRFGIPALRNGLGYEDASVRRLVQVVGPGPAGLLLYGGERWTAEEAVAHRLVDRCSEDPFAAVERVLAGLRGAPGPAIAATVASLRTAGR
jgi:enoyl-CoA hydratase/carnithine racemase